MIFLDAAFVPLLENLQDKLASVEKFVVLTDAAHMPETTLAGAQDYESFIADHSSEYEGPELDENAASALCYTSGTTGNPKGVLYSHRSTVLHSYAAALPDVMAMSVHDVLMPIVPMFHVNAWSIPYAAAMVGCKLVFPGGKMGDGETLQGPDRARGRDHVRGRTHGLAGAAGLPAGIGQAGGTACSGWW